MNILFLVNEPIREYSGIAKKIIQQVSALKKLGEKVFLSYLEEKDNYKFTGRYIDSNLLQKYSKFSLMAKLQRRCSYMDLFKFISAKNINLVYIRYIHFANPFFIHFLKKLKSSGVKVLLELPTYPYDKEYKYFSGLGRIAFSIEKIYRKQFRKCVTRIVTVSEHEKIFNIPTIIISNGIDLKSIELRKKNTADASIHLIGVATISFWHGYDRVIEGLRNYYFNWKPGMKKLFFHIVGNSSNAESIRYKDLVEEYNLQEFILFYGKKEGKELDDLFNKMDIAVGSLGCHRIQIKHIKSLKNREYCARGIPFFYSLIDPDFEGQDFIYKVPSNDEPVDIQKIIEFISNLKYDPKKIRRFAEENLTWEKQFKKILSEVKD